jgi:exportin-5
LDARALVTACGDKLTLLLTAATTNDANGAGEDDDAGWDIMGYTFVVERVVEESLSWRDEVLAKRPSSPNTEGLLAALDGGNLVKVLEWRPPEVSYDRAYQRLMLLDALRGVLRHASQERLCCVLRELFGYLAFNAPGVPQRHLFKVRRRAAQTLSHAAEAAPKTLVGQFDKLRDGASNIICSRLLCDIGSQHLCEALVLASNACEDVRKRRALLEAVVVMPINDLASTSVRDVLASPQGLLKALGVLRPNSSVTDVQTANTPAPDDIFCGVAVDTMRRSLGLLLGVARRASVCTSVDSKVLCAIPTKPAGGLQALVAEDASAAVLFRTISSSIAATCALHGLWAPPVSSALRADLVGRLALAPSLDEIRCKIDPAASGAVGILPRSRSDSAGYLKKPDPPLGHAAPRRDSVAAKWACMLNELRSSMYQLARLWIDSRCAFCDDSLQITASLFSACGLVQSKDATFLEAMEHRHVSSLLKHVLEPLVLRCPPSLYTTHLAPVLQRVVTHIEIRLALSWDNSSTSETAAFYRSSGLAMESFDDASQLLMAEAMRRDLSRQYLDVLQTAFALKGELAAPVSLASKAFDKYHKVQAEDNGENGARIQAARDRRAAHVGALHECLLPRGRGMDEVITPLIRTVVRSIRSWADVPTCRCAVKIAETVVQRCHSDASYWPVLELLFEEALGALVSEPSWLANAGCEYDMLSLCRASYVSLVLSSNPDRIGGKMPDHPPRREGPRRTLLGLPGISIAAVQHLETNLHAINAHKDQKNAFHELVVLALNAKQPVALPHRQSEDNPTVDASALREHMCTVLNLPIS